MQTAMPMNRFEGGRRCNKREKSEFAEEVVHMKKKPIIIISVIVLLCVIGGLIFQRYQVCPLQVLYAENETPRYTIVQCYWDGMNEDIESPIPQSLIADLLADTLVRKGTASNALPARCFEITAVVKGIAYRIVIGDDKTVSVAPVENLDTRTFWIDISGKLFEVLYESHLENGGKEFP